MVRGSFSKERSKEKCRVPPKPGGSHTARGNSKARGYEAGTCLASRKPRIAGCGESKSVGGDKA